MLTDTLFRYVLGQLSVLSDEELSELDFEAGLSALNENDISQNDRDELKKLFSTIQEQLGVSHHGIIGMKWGVRRYQNKDGSLTPAGKKRYNDDIAKQSVFGTASSFQVKTRDGEIITAEPVKPWSTGKKVLNALLGYSEKDELGRRGDANYTLNNSKGEKLGELSLISKDADTAYIDWITIDESQRGKGYASDIINNLLSTASDAGYSKVELNALKKPRPLYERLGFTYSDRSSMSIMSRINSFEFGCKHMEYDLSKLRHAHELFLMHHGILGMKWGVRRFQNEDGTLTSAGKTRYRKVVSNDGGIAPEKTRYKPKFGGVKDGPYEENRRRQEEMRKEFGAKSAHKDYNKAHDNKKVSEMSDKELRDRLNRLDMEARYNKMNPSTVERGKQQVNKAIKVMGTVATVSTTALTIYYNYEKIGKILKGE